VTSAHRWSRRVRHRVAALVAGMALLIPLLGIVAAGAPAAAAPAAGAAATATTAWQDGAFQLDPDAVVSESDIVLGRPNTQGDQSMPLGNGSLAVAAWAANGFTAQLNRSDTMPDRKSPGQVTIPGLTALTNAADFSGTLDLTDGVLEESGGGMTMKAWVSSSTDELIVDVTGADPATPETAAINLWSGRSPTAAVSGNIGTLAETWVDNSGSGASGQTFGSLAAITAGGTNVTASVVNSEKVQVSFKPNADGSFRVVVGAPAWTGGDAATTAAALLGSDATATESSLLATQDSSWSTFWEHSGLIQMTSTNGDAQYIENLRTLYLYEENASMKQGIYPGSQAGEADMFDWSEDKQTWAPNEYWLWNQRTEISANMSSGNFALNLPIFDMYIDDLPAIEAWTKAQMGGLPGACVPETMTFNGTGYYGGAPASQGASCALASSPTYNAEDITSGPELAVYMWDQYQDTDNLTFLKQAFPFMEATAQFLLAYQQVGSDGLLHSVANAHETQWAVQDPTIVLAADQAVFPMITQAAALVGDTSASDPLLAQFTAAVPEIPPYARTDDATNTQLLNPDYTQTETQAADATGTDMIGISYQPTASRQNDENIELEPVWPWDDITDQDPAMFTLAQRTYDNRPYKGGNDWDMDAIDAARLEMPSQVETQLVGITEGHQVYDNGFADIGDTVGYQPYLEQEAGVATAVDEALAQDYDGVLRFAPAWPSDWNVSGTVYVQNNTKVDVQVENGTLTTAAIEAGTTGNMEVENPWAGQSVEVVNGSTGVVVVPSTTSSTFEVPVVSGQSYLVEQPSAPTTALPFAQVTGSAPTTDRHMGPVQIGLDAAGAPATATVGTVLGSTNADYGVTEADDPTSGDATAATDVGGLSARTTGAGASGTNAMYFDIDDSVAVTGDYATTFTVAYYDSGTGTVSLNYDAGTADPNEVAGTITLTGTDTWKTATFTVSGAYFGGDENTGADFSLTSNGVPITVHSVAAAVTGPNVPAETEFPPVPAITSPKANATVPTASAISGTTEPDGTVTVSSGTTALCTATADDTGAWSCTPATPFTTGKQSITATVTDPTGLVSAASAATQFVASDLPPGTAVVGAVVGTTNASYGMSEDETPSGGFDGPTTAAEVGGLSARTTTDSNMYFNIDDSVAFAGDYTASFTVSYYDQGSGSFQVQYDDGTTNPYKSTANINLTNTNTWKTATVTTVAGDDAYFGGQQHSDADFRLRNGSGQITIHSVVVTINGAGVPTETEFPPTPAIASPAAGATVTTATPPISGTAEPDASVTVNDGTTPVCTATADDGGNWSCTPATGLSNGQETVTASATDPTASPGTASPPVSFTVAVASGAATDPGAPTIGTVTPHDGAASVVFTPPASNGGSDITGYTVTATDTTNPANGGQTATGTANPITVTGLTNGDTYTFTVTATNEVGTGPASAASAPVTPAAPPPTPKPQTITFTSKAPTAAVAGGPTYTVKASATSGLAVTVSVDPSSTSVCSLSGEVVSFTAAGTCTLEANQAGDAGYAPAAAVTQSIVVGPAVSTGVPTPDGKGYWEVTSDGGVYAFGDAKSYGSLLGTHLAAPIVGIAPTADGRGYWLVTSDGGIFSFGDAGFYGSTGALHLKKPIVAMAATPDGHGYWLVASDGGIFSFGDAGFYGSTGALHLNKPIVAMAATPDGHGYRLVASDGGIFSFGDAHFLGSMGATSLNRPVVGMAETSDGGGYWLVASDGGVFAFGDAAFHGSTGGTKLNAPIVAIAPTVDNGGYWEMASDGGVFAFGDAGFYGSTGGTPHAAPTVGAHTS
jgi:hypothetical protein